MFNIFSTTFAVCPICTAAVGAGLAISKSLGIDDTVFSVWIGGLLASVSLWTVNWLIKKKWTFTGFQALVGLLFYGSAFATLYFTNSLFVTGNTIFGIDKVIFGTLIGSLVFLGASELYQTMKRQNNGKAHFPFEKVVIPVAALALTSLVFYLITK